ncbi:patatin-like phospholipase family protein [Dokdonella soli]|uniref:Patatin-like phospholipase family protein n=1 Tax=Dokdonella soli TaxID=529810 RepID=A0ABN1IPQ1_9GAMM
MTNGEPTALPAPQSAAANHSSLSLVLGSGGARGYAHIGVIQELEAQGFAIRSIAGSSMGALVGGVYAAGKLGLYTDWVRPLQRFDVLRLLDWTLSGGGFIKGDRIINVLRELIGDADIEDLPIPYTAVAVDLDAQREVWFSRGPLFDAIRASIAIPTVFRPHHYQGRLFVDGGLLNPLPISPTLRDLTDATIAVDVNAPAEPLDALAPRVGDAEPRSDHGGAGQASPTQLPEGSRPLAIDAPRAGYRRKIAEFVESVMEKRERRAAEQEPGVFELFARSLDLVQETITRLKLAAQPPDLLITIPRNVCAFYEFHRAEEVIEHGRRRTREALARWQRPPAR